MDNIDIVVNYYGENPKILTKYKENLLNLFKSKNVVNYFKNYDYVLKNQIIINIMSKSQLKDYLLKTCDDFKSGVPDWVQAVTLDDGIYLIDINDSNLENLTLVSLHEVIHFLSKKLKSKADRALFLEEALATYICSQMDSGKFSRIIEDYNNDNFKKISFFLDNNDSVTFAKNNGYYYAFFFMKFLKNKYYPAKIIEYIINFETLKKEILTLGVEYEKFLVEQIKYYSNPNFNN